MRPLTPPLRPPSSPRRPSPPASSLATGELPWAPSRSDLENCRRLTFHLSPKISKSWEFYSTCSCSLHNNSLHIAPFRVCNISKCSSRDALHFVPVQHVHLSSSWCPNVWCKSASCCYLLLIIRTCGFVIFVAFNLCILWAWDLHATGKMGMRFTEVYAMYFFDLCGD